MTCAESRFARVRRMGGSDRSLMGQNGHLWKGFRDGNGDQVTFRLPLWWSSGHVDVMDECGKWRLAMASGTDRGKFRVLKYFRVLSNTTCVGSVVGGWLLKIRPSSVYVAVQPRPPPPIATLVSSCRFADALSGEQEKHIL